MTEIIFIISFTFFLILGLLFLLYKRISKDLKKVEVVSQETTPELYETPSRLKFEHSWFDKDYVTPYFYYNGWKPIMKICNPILDYEDYESREATYSLNRPLTHVKDEFSSVGKCLEHNKRINEEIVKRNKEREQSRKEKKERLKEAFKKANS